MNRQGISLAEGTFLALLAATTMLTPVTVSAQSIAPGEPSARAPIAIAQNLRRGQAQYRQARSGPRNGECAAAHHGRH